MANFLWQPLKLIICLNMSRHHSKKHIKNTIGMNPEEIKEQEEKVEASQPEVETKEEQQAPASEHAEEENAGKAVEPQDDMAAQLEELKDKFLRLSAEFDNYRKRTMKEKAELVKTGGEKVICSILPILDDMERAIKNMEASEAAASMKEGVELIYNKFLKVLHEDGVEKMETENAAFDTDFHEAIALVPAPDEAQKGKILDCVQNGYKLNDKVIRHAKVVVGQ